MRPATLIAFLGLSRGLGALVNIVHDCDEVFNYWEPLHFLVHGTGMQTWEYRCGRFVIMRSGSLNSYLSCAGYCANVWSQSLQEPCDCCSSKYALRPYLYILVHWPVTKAFSMVTGANTAGLYAFYGTRVVLSLACLVLEARLIKCASSLQGQRRAQ